MRFLLRVIGLLVIIYAGLSVLRGILGAFTSGKQVRATSEPGHLVKDPVCGTYVPEATALKKGSHSFCSEACRSKFEINAG